MNIFQTHDLAGRSITIRREEIADSLACYFLDVDTGWGVSTSAISNADALELGRKLVFTSHAA